MEEGRNGIGRLGRTLQMGALLGLGFAFFGGESPEARAGGGCPGSLSCGFDKPNVLILLDASSSMGLPYTDAQTRWQASVDGIEAMVLGDNGFFTESTHLALMRFGHDPDPATPGSPLGDLVDGVSLDVGWYDPNLNPHHYFECAGEAAVQTLSTLTPPSCNAPNCEGVGSWLRGGLEAAGAYIAQSSADHPADGERPSVVIVVTDGPWTSADGSAPEGDPSAHPDDPVPVAGALFSSGVPVYVVALADAAADPSIPDVASAGGTVVPLELDPNDVHAGFEVVGGDILETTVIPACDQGAPRIMMLIDASSSMLNVAGPLGPIAGGMGATPWDHVRQSVTGSHTFLHTPVPGTGVERRLDEVAIFGLAIYGSAGDATLLANYGSCPLERFDWALDPNTSCGPGCVDPWGGPPIIWSPQGPESTSYPDFAQDTYSAMPSCNAGIGLAGMNRCTGSDNALHEGLELVAATAEAHLNFGASEAPLFNILITDGGYRDPGGSTDEQVSAALIDAYANANTTTFVVALGEEAMDEASDLACWGSGGTGIPCVGGSIPAYEVNGSAIWPALEDIVSQIPIDPCCGFNQCELPDDSITIGVGDDDPWPGDDGNDTTSSSGGGTSSTSSGGTTSGGTVPPELDSSSGSTITTGSTSTDEGGASPSPMTTAPGTSGPMPETSGEPGTDDEAGGVTVADGCGCTNGPDGAPTPYTLWTLALLCLRRRRESPSSP